MEESDGLVKSMGEEKRTVGLLFSSCSFCCSWVVLDGGETRRLEKENTLVLTLGVSFESVVK